MAIFAAGAESRDLLSNAGFANDVMSDGGIAMLAADLEAATTVMLTANENSSLKKVICKVQYVGTNCGDLCTMGNKI